MIRDLLHADRVFKLMDAGLSFSDAAALDDKSADYLIEAWEIATSQDDDDDGDCVTVMIYNPE